MRAADRARSRPWASGVAVAAGVAVLAMSACGDERRIVALHGCGVDPEIELSSLRVVLRGDFPPSSRTELVLGPGETGGFERLVTGTAGVTVEGSFGSFPAAVGRTRALDGDALVVYFAPPDSLCSVPSGIPGRAGAAGAVGAEGEVLLVGGRDGDGALLDELVVIDLDADDARVMGSRLPDATAGATLHAAGGRRFLLVGGGHRGAPWFSTSTIDLDADGDAVAAPVPLVVDGDTVGLAFHGAAALPDGRILVVGGCATIDAVGRCTADDGAADAVVLDRTFTVDPADPLDTRPGPPLAAGRYGATVLVGRDGTAYVAGGRNPDGSDAVALERLDVDADAWETLDAEITVPIAGAALLEGGTLVLAHDDGSVAFWSPRGEGPLELGQALPSAPRRPLTTLPGERVLVDGWVLPVGQAGGEPAAIDLSLSTPGGAGPGQRSGPDLLALPDGSVLVVGGTTDGELAVPYVARMRPPLDGPDEEIPDVAGPDPSAFVSTPPGAAQVDGDRLVLAGAGTVAALPTAHVHVRGFRSRGFRFDFSLEVQDARAHVVLSQGARRLLSIGIDGDGVSVHRRGARGEVDAVACTVDGAPVLGDGPGWSLTVASDALELRQGDEVSVTCPLDSPDAGQDPAFAVGIGVSGAGEVAVRELRLGRR
jgi:hypothetical protein